jgi:SAM-dependent methyltransferase
MLLILKKLYKYLLPKKIQKKLNLFRVKTKYNRTKKLFESSLFDSNQLSINELRRLQKKYPFPPEYGYSSEILDMRGRERADQLISLIPSITCNKYLELGCWDGMVCYYLNKHGKKAYGVDNRGTGFDKRALEGGVDLRVMDASDLKFENDCFDVVFSYDSFEHFSDPAGVLSEIYRVLRPGGYIYLEFGPLFMSPMGLHAYRQITVPYSQHLFSEQTLINFLVEENLGTLDFNHVNRWSLIQFRNLFNSYSGKLEKEKYIENSNYNHLDLVRKYAPVFKSKTANFDELTCRSIEVLFRKL